MIKVERGDKPEVLKNNADKWTEEFLEARNLGKVTDTVRYRYRHSNIKQTLRQDAYDKCVYCESKVSHANPGQTDHIAPVSIKPERYVCWDNLAYVCEECNRRKGAYYDETHPLVNPYEEEPSEFIWFYGPAVFHRVNNERGRVTKAKLGLSRLGLYERREEKLGHVFEIIEKYRGAPEGAYKQILKEEIEHMMAPHAEYAAATRSFVAAVLGEEYDNFSVAA